ncbi:hypothetical protein FOCC_FOCC002325 [Frankliniella occidentalis]|nr:hypothetical protein FOCC_FOCC002325 [Frankliniella occidentalis]
MMHWIERSTNKPHTPQLHKFAMVTTQSSLTKSQRLFNSFGFQSRLFTSARPRRPCTARASTKLKGGIMRNGTDNGLVRVHKSTARAALTAGQHHKGLREGVSSP